MPAVPKAALHQKILVALGDLVRTHDDLDKIPFVVRLTSDVGLSVFAFTLTPSKSATGRPTGEHKAQLIVPGQKRGAGEKGRLLVAPYSAPVIAAWSPQYDVFVLWDGYAHEEFAYSKNMQVKDTALSEAQTRGVYEVQRNLPALGGVRRGLETVVVCTPSQLKDGIQRRIQLSAERQARLAGYA
ncbi:MAG TPA: hypothetical protein VFC93_17245 [Chloroflexota bacterium]|nr:hypothetical protein [Chloroflexota bacterium]